MKNSKLKKIASFMLAVMIALASKGIIYAEEQTATYEYEFYDGSSDEWGESAIVAISESYALISIDFDTLKESKSETYESIGVDISEISASDLYSSTGEIIDIGVDNIYIVSLSEPTETYYTITTEDITLMTLYINEAEITATTSDDGTLMINTETNTIGTPITDGDGNLAAITITEDTAISVSYLYDYIKDYLPAEETEEELDFTTLESLIEQAQEIDIDDYDDTAEFETAFNDAKTTYLNATTQEEINSASLALSAAISGLYAEADSKSTLLSLLTESSDFAILIAAMIAIVVILLVLIIAFGKKKKKKEKDTEKTRDKKSTNANEFDEIEYETGYENASVSKSSFQYETDMPQQQSHEKQQTSEKSLWDQSDDEDDIPTTMLDAAFLIRKNTGEKIPITKNCFTIGRSTADYRISDNPTVGRLHCAFYKQNNDYYIEDRNSTNGTYVNKERISSRTLLHNGDTVRLANEEFDYRHPSSFAEYEDKSATMTESHRRNTYHYEKEYTESEETDTYSSDKNVSQSEYTRNRSSSNRRRGMSSATSEKGFTESVQTKENSVKQSAATASDMGSSTSDDDDLYY